MFALANEISFRWNDQFNFWHIHSVAFMSGLISVNIITHNCLQRESVYYRPHRYFVFLFLFCFVLFFLFYFFFFFFWSSDVAAIFEEIWRSVNWYSCWVRRCKSTGRMDEWRLLHKHSNAEDKVWQRKHWFGTRDGYSIFKCRHWVDMFRDRL